MARLGLEGVGGEAAVAGGAGTPLREGAKAPAPRAQEAQSRARRRILLMGWERWRKIFGGLDWEAGRCRMREGVDAVGSDWRSLEEGSGGAKIAPRKSQEGSER